MWLSMSQDCWRVKESVSVLANTARKRENTLLSSTLELSQQVEVETPKGRGRLFLVTDYGSEIEKIFTVVLYNGTMFEYPIDKIRLTQNITMARESQTHATTPYCSRGPHSYDGENSKVCSKCGEFLDQT